MNSSEWSCKILSKCFWTGLCSAKKKAFTLKKQYTDRSCSVYIHSRLNCSNISKIVAKMYTVSKIYRVVHPKSDIGVLYQSSVYSETTWSCNMSYERKFCVLSEYVRLQHVRPLIKSVDWSKWDSVDFGKCANSQVMVNLRSLSILLKLPRSMTINMHTI